MDEKIIIRYLEGKAAEGEREEVLAWIWSNDENQKAFNRLKNIWVLSNLPKTRASAEEVNDFSKRIRRTKMKRSIYWGSIAASILLIVAILIGNEMSSYKSQIAFLSNQGMAQLEYKTNKGIKGMVTLPDGSKVWLNSDSYIKCPAKFEGKTRKVEFSGEGYFEVVKNAKIPMVINLGNGISVRVKGTTFNLSSYSNDKDISALLLSGIITVVRHQPLFDKEMVVKPNEKITIEKQNSNVELLAPKETFSTLGWKEGWLVFDEIPMREVLKKLERWHGVTFTVKDPEILNQNFTGRFKEESISQILEMMNRISLVRYEVKDTKITLMSYKNDGN